MRSFIDLASYLTWATCSWVRRNTRTRRDRTERHVAMFQHLLEGMTAAYMKWQATDESKPWAVSNMEVPQAEETATTQCKELTIVDIFGKSLAVLTWPL